MLIKKDFLKKGSINHDNPTNSFLIFDPKSGIFIDTDENSYTPYEINKIKNYQINDVDVREKARKYLAELSNKVIKSTGRPLYESLNYKGVSAWWFLEIALHEPVFLKMRSEIFLSHLKSQVNTTICIKKVSEANILPTHAKDLKINYENQNTKFTLKKHIRKIPDFITCSIQFLERQIPNKFIKLVKAFYSQLVCLLLRPKDILIFLENENIRTHYNFNTKKFEDTLTYAEGILEMLYNEAGKKIQIFDRSCTNKKFRWIPKVVKFPRSSGNKLPKLFHAVIDEVHSHISLLINNEISKSQMIDIVSTKIAEFDHYNKFIKKLKVKVLFVYNWEGVFRPLMAAAKINNIKIVGVQQALGPYSHALNHSEIGYWCLDNHNSLHFPIPDKFLVWGDFHKEQLINFGYPKKLLISSGYARLDKHYNAQKNKGVNREMAAKILGLNPNKKYLLFTVQFRVLNTCLVNEIDFKETLLHVIKLADLYDFNIIIKPWSGDDISFLMKQARIRPDRIYFAPQNVITPNSHLLLLTDWCVSTFSSIIGEATLCDNLCFLLHYPESKSYFESKHMSIYDNLSIRIDYPRAIQKTLTPYIESTELKKEKLQEFKQNLKPIFGPCDGKAAKRASQTVLKML